MRIRGEESDAVPGGSGEGRDRKRRASDPPALCPQKHAADERELESEKDREPTRVGSAEQALGTRDEGVGKLALSEFQGDCRGPNNRHQ